MKTEAPSPKKIIRLPKYTKKNISPKFQQTVRCSSKLKYSDWILFAHPYYGWTGVSIHWILSKIFENLVANPAILLTFPCASSFLKWFLFRFTTGIKSVISRIWLFFFTLDNEMASLNLIKLKCCARIFRFSASTCHQVEFLYQNETKRHNVNFPLLLVWQVLISFSLMLKMCIYVKIVSRGRLQKIDVLRQR